MYVCIGKYNNMHPSCKADDRLAQILSNAEDKDPLSILETLTHRDASSKLIIMQYSDSMVMSALEIN